MRVVDEREELPQASLLSLPLSSVLTVAAKDCLVGEGGAEPLVSMGEEGEEEEDDDDEEGEEEDWEQEQVLEDASRRALSLGREKAPLLPAPASHH